MDGALDEKMLFCKVTHHLVPEIGTILARGMFVNGNFTIRSSP